MDKSILEDYIDACEFIKETEAEIKRLKKKRRKMCIRDRCITTDVIIVERI